MTNDVSRSPREQSQYAAAQLLKPLNLFRSGFDQGMTALALVLTLMAAYPLVSVTFSVLTKGGSGLKPEVLTSLPAAPGLTDIPNGFANAILGTMIVVVTATAMSVPMGVLTGIFLAEYSRGSTFGNFIRFMVKILTSVPSIIVGAFAYAVIVLQTKSFSAFASAFALAVLMLPVIALTTEEALKLVPRPVRAASGALGGTQFQAISRVVLPAALPGIATGVLLAIARAAGETAPVLLTSIFTDNWPDGLFGPTPTMAVLIFNYANSPDEIQSKMAWVAAFVLLALVLLLNVSARLIISKRNS